MRTNLRMKRVILALALVVATSTAVTANAMALPAFHTQQNNFSMKLDSTNSSADSYAWCYPTPCEEGGGGAGGGSGALSGWKFL